MKLTLDINCIIAVEENRPEATAIRQLIKNEAVDIAVSAGAATERRRGSTELIGPSALRSRMAAIGIGETKLLPVLGIWGLSYWDLCIWVRDDQDPNLSKMSKLWTTLFPRISENLHDYCRQRDVDPSDKTSKPYNKWRNALCDVMAFWSHQNAQRDVFVTTDSNFAKRLTPAAGFPTAVIKSPEQASTLL